MFTFDEKTSSEFIFDQQVKGNEHRPKSNEQRAKSNEQRAKTNEQWATSIKFHLV